VSQFVMLDVRLAFVSVRWAELEDVG